VMRSRELPDLKPEENFVPGLRSRFRLTGPTANLRLVKF
jgi:hypothetical protein